MYCIVVRVLAFILFSCVFSEAHAADFVVVGSMNVARTGHTATKLYDGTVLIVGGKSVTAQVSAEIYFPETKSFSAIASPLSARSYHTATLLDNGKVLITGGPDNSAELYDPATGTFYYTKNAAGNQTVMSVARKDHTATKLKDGRVLIAGGRYTDSRGNVIKIDTAEIFDPVSGTFSLVQGVLATGRYQHTATLLQSGKVLLAGGYYLNSADLYDPVTDMISPTGFMNNARYSHSAVGLPNGKVLFVGGGNHSTGYWCTDSAELYDEAEGSFVHTMDSLGNTTKMWSARADFSMNMLSNGLVLIAGGRDNSNDVQYKAAEIFDYVSGTFSQVPTTMARGRYAHTAVLLDDDNLLISGGTGLNGAIPNSELYLLPPVDLSNARPLPEGTTYSGSLPVCEHPKPTYVVLGPIAVKSPSNFSIDFNHQYYYDATFRITLVDEKGEEYIRFVSGDTTKSIYRSVGMRPGNYYIVIRDVSWWICSAVDVPFTLAYYVAPSDAVEQENNDSIAMANPIALDKEYSGRLQSKTNIERRNDVDYYRFSFSQPGKLILNFTGDSNSNSLWNVSVVDAAETNIYDFTIGYQERLMSAVKAFSLPAGDYYIKIKSVAFWVYDGLNRLYTVKANYSSDYDPPDTSISTHPPKISNSSAASFEFTSSEFASTFLCSLDGANYDNCSPPHAFMGLVDGVHSLLVSAVDPSLNEDQTPASYSWTIDTIPPAITIDPVSSPGFLPNQTITGTRESDATISLTSSSAVDVSVAYPTSSTWSARITGSAPGDYTLTATAIDSAGNASSASTIIIFKALSKAGDCDNSVTISISEVQAAINMYLGIMPVQACVDTDSSNGVTIAEVQKVINGYLGL